MPPIEKGDAGNLSDDNKSDAENKEKKVISAAKTGQDINTLLMQQLKEMQKEITELKSKGMPPAIAGGVNDDQFAKLLTALTKAIKEKPDNEKLDISKGFIDPADIDPNDFLENGQQFFANTTGYVIVDDIRQGFPVSTPFKNIIIFRYQATQRIKGNGKEEQLQNFSTYVSHSKKEVQWLRDHRYFGVAFFETAAQALNTDVKIAQRMLKFMTAINSMGNYDLMRRAKEYGLPTTNDTKTLRVLLATKLAENEELSEKDASIRKAVEMNEALVFKDK